MRFSRSHRRHHAKRLKVKRWKENARCSNPQYQNWAWVENNACRRVHTATQCSCAMCGNPRRHYGNSAKALTRQELRISMVEDL